MMSIVNTEKSFEIVDGDGIKSVTISNLSLKQKDKVWEDNTEIIKERKRKEFLKLASLMEGKEKMKFLVEASNSNVPTVEEIIAESQTVRGIASTLDLVSVPKVDWAKVLTCEEAVTSVLKCYYWALNIDIPDEIPEREATAEEKPDFFSQETSPQMK